VADDPLREVRESVRTLERRLDRLQGGGGATAAERASLLAAEERDLWRLIAGACRVVPSFGGHRSHPALDAASRWRRSLLEHGLEEPADRLEELLERLIGDEAERWRERCQEAELLRDPQACFDALAQASRLDLEVVRRRRPGSRWEPPPAERREPVRRALLDALRSAPATPETRDRWTAELVDRADDGLTSVDGLAPGEAVAWLQVACEDLRWHLDRIEPERGPRRRLLSRRWRRLRAEHQERLLQGRLESTFGPRRAARWERAVVCAILLVLVLLAVPLTIELSPSQHRWYTWIDTAFCAFFLWDFGVKCWMVRGNGVWVRRHLVTDLLPSLPFGLLLLSGPGPDPARAGWLLRLLRLPRLARYLRILMPVIRAVRAFGFLTRGLDRLVRQHGHVLNHSVILYPTPGERRRSAAADRGLESRIWALRAGLNALWRRTLQEGQGQERAAVADARLGAMELARASGWSPAICEAESSLAGGGTHEAEELLRGLSTVSAEEIEGELGGELTARVAAAVRLLARPLMRWIPVLGGFVPRLTADMPDAQVTARAVRRITDRLLGYFHRVLAFADLYGTVTPAELVGRVGSALVKRTARPANRLLLFGGIYLIVLGVLQVAHLEALQAVSNSLQKIVGPTLILLGSICFIFLGLGWWLQRLANDASTFYDQIAAAQYLHLTEAIKIRQHPRDARILEERVFAPERVLAGEEERERAEECRESFIGDMRTWLLEGKSREAATASFDPVVRTGLLYRDMLDGALLAESDTRTTSQLLGNLALRRVREVSQRISRRERKALEALDLARQRAAIRGPYLWFNFISKAVAHSAARLIIEYNQYAIPLEEMASATEAHRERYQAWIESRGAAEPTNVKRGDLRAANRQHLTTAFTALHFLDDDERRDAEIEKRFGRPVLKLMQRDRRALFRRVFGSYPLHRLPRDQRVLNLRHIYQSWLEGGRALLFPFKMARRLARWTGVGLRFVARAVGEIRNPRLNVPAEEDAGADFATAIRKIGRIRGPGAHACLWQRVLLDVEYLGVGLPGVERSGLEGRTADADLRFLDSPARQVRAVERERRAAAIDMQRLGRLLEEGLFDRVRSALPSGTELGREHLRAAAMAYRADIAGLRSQLSCGEILSEVYRDAAQRDVLPPHVLPRPRLHRAFASYWKVHAPGDGRARQAAWRATLHDEGGAARALLAWSRLGVEAARRRGEERMVQVLRHPNQLTEQLVTLRAVQTLSLIDILNYRTHVHRLGGYAEGGDPPGPLLELRPTE